VPFVSSPAICSTITAPENWDCSGIAKTKVALCLKPLAYSRVLQRVYPY
jgi:hypothetical protein